MIPRTLAAVLLALNVYRAATQSITHDEALTWSRYVDGSWSGMFRVYDANHHVLFSILAKLAVSVFGLSEFSLRLPSLLAGALYFASSIRISESLLGRNGKAALAAAMFCLNPYILDFLSAARGYGLALALFMFALWRILDEKPALPAGFALGGAIAANLTFAIPALALMAAVPGQAVRLAAPAALVSAVVLAGPLRFAERVSFYAGTSHPAEAAESIILRSLFHGGGSDWARLIGIVALPAIAVLAIALARRTRALRVAGVLLGVSLAVTAGMHFLLGIPYPWGRTALYWIPLFSFALVAFAAHIRSPIALAPVAACVAMFALNFNLSHYADWRYDASTKAIVTGLDAKARIGGSWQLAPAARFYRRASAESGYDYYLLLPDDIGEIERRGLRELSRHSFTGVILAAPR